MRRTVHTYNAEVTDAQYGEIVDAWTDAQPTRADVQDERPVSDPVPPHEFDAECPCLVCSWRGVGRGVE